MEFQREVSLAGRRGRIGIISESGRCSRGSIGPELGTTDRVYGCAESRLHDQGRGIALRTLEKQNHFDEGRRRDSRKARQRNEAGFIITLELVVLLTIFSVVIIFAISLFQRWLIASIDPLGGKHVVVYDSKQPSGSLITRTDSFVGNEGPVRVYRVDTHEAAILGTRAETAGGFTTRQRLYFSDSTDCTGTQRWILDPTTAAAAATQFLPWSLSPPGVAGYGHPVSDYYTLQTVAFAMGPGGYLHRAPGSLSTDPPGQSAFDPLNPFYPASEWASERYDADRCRQLGPLTSDPGVANAEQQALAPYLVMVDNSYTINDKDGIPYSPMFWSPTKINPVPPVPVIGSNDVQFTDPLAEGDPLPTPPSGGEDSPPP